jgi:hypothetical protein
MPEQKTIAHNACPACGTWACADCGARRQYANRFSRNPHRCPRCSSANGQIRPVHHEPGRAIDHVESYTEMIAEGKVPRYPL